MFSTFVYDFSLYIYIYIYIYILVCMVLSRIFQSGTFLKVIKVIWHPNRGLSCNSRGDGNPAPKSNHTASTLAPRTIPDWHL